jgi:hypothetical protein
VPATLVIKNTRYDNESKKVYVEYEVVDWGSLTNNLILGEEGDKKILFYIGNETNASKSYIDDSKFFDTTLKTASFNHTFSENTESILIKIMIHTELGTYLKTDNSTIYFKTGKKPNIDALTTSPVFNILPTVAYRKNHLGINVINPSDNGKENAIIVIGETSGRDTIYF